MLTLRELRTMTAEPLPAGKVPTVKFLLESGEPVVAGKRLADQSAIWVYRNGFVIYQAGGRRTVFPLQDYADYRYDTLTGFVETIPASFFEEQSWEVRLVLEGEDRITVNQEVLNGKHQVSYSAVSEEWGELGTTSDALDGLIGQETVDSLLSEMTESQQKVVRRYFLMEETQQEIAKELGISRQAVTDMLGKAIRRVRRSHGIREQRIFRKKK